MISQNAKRDSVIFMILLHAALLIGLLCIEKYATLDVKNVLKAIIVYIYIVLLFLIFYKIEDEVVKKRLQCCFFKRKMFVTDFIAYFFSALFILSAIYIPFDHLLVDQIMMKEYSHNNFTAGDYNFAFCSLIAGTVTFMNHRRSKRKDEKQSVKTGEKVGRVAILIIAYIISFILLMWFLGLQFG